jgi:hypothetical protein
MIAEAEIRRYAARWQVDPMVVDLDYGLGWFLAALMSVGTPASVLRFKGGTCLRKCYFPDYRRHHLAFGAERNLVGLGIVGAFPFNVQASLLRSAKHRGVHRVANDLRRCASLDCRLVAQNACAQYF